MSNNFKGSFSDLISHLRTINQSIVLISVALLMTALLAEKPDNISVAIQNLALLEKITYWENWNSQFVTSEFFSDPGVAESHDDWSQDYDIEFPVVEQYRSGEVADSTHTIGISAPLFTFAGWDYTGFLTTESEVNVQAPKTVVEFNQLWDKSRSVQAIYTGELLDHAYVQLSPELPVEKVTIRLMTKDNSYVSQYGIFTLGAFRPIIFSPQDIDEIDRELYGLSTTVEQGYGDDVIWKFWIPASSKPSIGAFTFDASSYLCREMKMEKENCDGTFEQVFPELYLATQEFRNLTFGDTIKMLETQREGQLQSFNLLGFNLPASETRWIGSLAILFLQLYFYLLLRTLAVTKVQNDFPAWIGVFSDSLSQKIAAGSVTILPFVSICVLNYRWFFMSWQEVALSILLITSSLILSQFIFSDFILTWNQPVLSETVSLGHNDVHFKKSNKVVNAAKRKKH